jgi:hypothetical protein
MASNFQVFLGKIFSGCRAGMSRCSITTARRATGWPERTAGNRSDMPALQKIACRLMDVNITEMLMIVKH